MAQVLGNTRILALAFLAAAPAWANDALSGVFQGVHGPVRFTQVAGKVKGISEGGGVCNWSRGDVLFEGVQEGSVLLGELKVCQAGPDCETRSFPVMAIHEPSENVFSAHLPADGGCQVKGLRDRVYVLTGSQAAQGEVAQARQVAARRLTKDEAAAAEKAFTAAGRYLEQRKYQKAVEEYERGLRYHPSNYAAFIQLGVARMKLDEPELALRAYGSARTFAPKVEPVIHYNMACAHARLGNKEQALAQLKVAVDHGFNNADVMRRDPDLNALLRDDETFLALTAAAARAPRRGN